MNRVSEQTWAEIRTAYASGIGLREIARNMGIPAGTVLARAKRKGWTRQIQEAKAIVPRDTSLTVDPAQAAALTLNQRGERHVERMAGIVELTLPYVERMGPNDVLLRVDQIEKLDKVARRTFGLKDDGPQVGLSLQLLNIRGAMA